MGTRVAIYTRTSTNDGRQYHENQLDKLREFAQRMNWTVAAEYQDSASGAQVKRPKLDELMTAAARRSFDIVLVFDLSRLTRSGPMEAFALIERLNSSKVEFWSATEEHFRTTGPAGQMFIALAAYLATAERDTIRSRIFAGIARARKAGKSIGRPAAVIDRQKIADMRDRGESLRQIAKSLGVSKATIERALAAAKKEKPTK
jgi:DNA invertase Pin-like site-specific DNA recombinase